MQGGQQRSVEVMTGWSAEDELVIAMIQQIESVSRPEAIRRMQRRKKVSLFANDREWYATRLNDLWLLDFSIPLRNGFGSFVLAVPIGGRRRGGFVSLPSPKYAQLAAERLKGNTGFPNIRIERSTERSGYDVVRWGESKLPIVGRRNEAEAQIAGHRTAGEFFGYSDSAIRTSLFEQFDREAVLAAERLCRNPRCTGADDGGPGSLAHLRADARYCDDTCKKAGQRSLRHENETLNRQCLCGSKRDKTGSLAHSTNMRNVRLKSPAIAISGFCDGDNKPELNVNKSSRPQSGLNR